MKGTCRGSLARQVDVSTSKILVFVKSYHKSSPAKNTNGSRKRSSSIIAARIHPAVDDVGFDESIGKFWAYYVCLAIFLQTVFQFRSVLLYSYDCILLRTKVARYYLFLKCQLEQEPKEKYDRMLKQAYTW